MAQYNTSYAIMQLMVRYCFYCFVYVLAPGDYGPQELYTVRFPAGSVMESFDINIVNDDILESDETFLLDITIMMLPNGIVIGQPASVEVTIVETTGETCILMIECYSISLYGKPICSVNSGI